MTTTSERAMVVPNAPLSGPSVHQCLAASPGVDGCAMTDTFFFPQKLTTEGAGGILICHRTFLRYAPKQSSHAMQRGTLCFGCWSMTPWKEASHEIP
jgi:hypothetical protein